MLHNYRAQRSWQLTVFHGMERNGTELVAEHGGRGCSYKRMIVAGFCGEARQLVVFRVYKLFDLISVH